MAPSLDDHVEVFQPPLCHNCVIKAYIKTPNMDCKPSSGLLRRLVHPKSVRSIGCQLRSLHPSMLSLPALPECSSPPASWRAPRAVWGAVGGAPWEASESELKAYRLQGSQIPG